MDNKIKSYHIQSIKNDLSLTMNAFSFNLTELLKSGKQIPHEVTRNGCK